LKPSPGWLLELLVSPPSTAIKIKVREELEETEKTLSTVAAVVPSTADEDDPC
jgi:hypothetical protein